MLGLLQMSSMPVLRRAELKDDNKDGGGFLRTLDTSLICNYAVLCGNQERQRMMGNVMGQKEQRTKEGGLGHG